MVGVLKYPHPGTRNADDMAVGAWQTVPVYDGVDGPPGPRGPEGPPHPALGYTEWVGTQELNVADANISTLGTSATWVKRGSLIANIDSTGQITFTTAGTYLIGLNVNFSNPPDHSIMIGIYTPSATQSLSTFVSAGNKFGSVMSVRRIAAAGTTVATANAAGRDAWLQVQVNRRTLPLNPMKSAFPDKTRCVFSIKAARLV